MAGESKVMSIKTQNHITVIYKALNVSSWYTDM